MKEAGTIFQKILRFDPDNFDAWFNLAVSKAKSGCLEEALATFRQAEKRRDNDQLLKSNIITILQDLKRFEEAMIIKNKEINVIKIILNLEKYSTLY